MTFHFCCHLHFKLLVKVSLKKMYIGHMYLFSCGFSVSFGGFEFQRKGDHLAALYNYACTFLAEALVAGFLRLVTGLLC